MVFSKLRRKRHRKTKWKLVVEFCPGRGVHYVLPQYANSLLHWQGVIEIRRPGDLVEEYFFTPDQRLYLKEFLNVLGEEVPQYYTPDALGYQLKVYLAV